MADFTFHQDFWSQMKQLVKKKVDYSKDPIEASNEDIGRLYALPYLIRRNS